MTSAEDLPHLSRPIIEPKTPLLAEDLPKLELIHRIETSMSPGSDEGYADPSTRGNCETHDGAKAREVVASRSGSVFEPCSVRGVTILSKGGGTAPHSKVGWRRGG